MEKFSDSIFEYGVLYDIAFSGHAFTQAQQAMHAAGSMERSSFIEPDGQTLAHMPHPVHRLSSRSGSGFFEDVCWSAVLALPNALKLAMELSGDGSSFNSDALMEFVLFSRIFFLARRPNSSAACMSSKSGLPAAMGFCRVL